MPDTAGAVSSVSSVSKKQTEEAELAAAMYGNQSREICGATILFCNFFAE